MLSVALVFAGVDLTAQSAPVVTLDQAVQAALVQNERLLNQRDDVTQADFGVRVAQREFRPRVVPNVLGSFGQTDVSAQTYRLDLLQRFTTGTEVRVGAGAATAQIPGDAAGSDVRFYNTDTTVTLSQPLLRGFGPAIARNGLAAAELRKSEAVRGQALAEQQIALEVAVAYYRLVAQTVSIDVSRQGLDRARRLRDASEAKLDAGLVSQLDVLRAQQLVTQAESQYFDTQAAVDEARDQLTYLMGRDRGEPFTVDLSVPTPDDAPVDAVAATDIALDRRLDLTSRRAQTADAERLVRVARNQRLPQFDVNLALTRRETAGSLSRSFGTDGFQVATFFTIAMPQDRGAAALQFQSAALDQERRRRELRALERQVGDDVRRALRERDRTLRNVIATATNVDLARREVEVAQLRYERGLSNNLDVVTAESGLLGAELRRLQALTDAAVMALRVRTVLGVLDPRAGLDTRGALLPPPGPRP